MVLFRSKILRYTTVIIALLILAVAYFYFFQFRPPRNFPQAAVIKVSNGTGLSQIAEELKEQHIIRSPFWFTNFVIMQKQERQIVGGEYYFEGPMNVYQVARRLAVGDFKTEQLKTTIPEGSTSFDISNILVKNYPDFDASAFITLALEKEGYLFPDTYKFGASVKPQKVVETMHATYLKKINQQEVQEAIKKYGRPVDEIIKMASILEGEARQMKTRQIIAGILWRRIELGMPLQVDAAFKYVNGKSSADLTLSDLKIDSPYNTYINKGLPPTPISNPGIGSIMAAVTPVKTRYLYFLTDKNGNMHYAETLEEHAANKARYLK